MCRIVFQYWDFNGKLLAENDPCQEGSKTIQTQIEGTFDEERFKKLLEEYQKKQVRIRFSEKGESHEET